MTEKQKIAIMNYLICPDLTKAIMEDVEVVDGLSSDEIETFIDTAKTKVEAMVMGEEL